MQPIPRRELLDLAATRIATIERDRPVLVGIDGISGAGKTTFADELAPLIQAKNRQVIRASIDGFHRPHRERIARGEFCPHGYYEDSFDYPALQAQLLDPLRNFHRGLHVNTVAFDYRYECAAVPSKVCVSPSAVLLFEGVFLFRPEIVGYWDLKLFIDISFETSLLRGLARDAQRLGGSDSARKKYELRYAPGQQFYLQASRAKEIAEILFCNETPHTPRVHHALRQPAVSPP